MLCVILVESEVAPCNASFIQLSALTVEPERPVFPLPHGSADLENVATQISLRRSKHENIDVDKVCLVKS